MIKAGIIGATGYAGANWYVSIRHKEVEIAWYGSRSYVDENMHISEYVNWWTRHVLMITCRNWRQVDVILRQRHRDIWHLF